MSKTKSKQYPKYRIKGMSSSQNKVHNLYKDDPMVFGHGLPLDQCMNPDLESKSHLDGT